MDKEKSGVRPDAPQGQGQGQGKPEPIDRSTERIAVAVENIDRTLERRPLGSGRNAALVKLLGEAPRVAAPRRERPRTS